MVFIGKKCPVCEKAFEDDDDIVVCPKCGAPYHRDCYMIKGSCIFPELHKTGEAWKSEEEQQEAQTESDDSIICAACGHKNSKDSIVCEKCGEFLSTEGDDADKSKGIFGRFIVESSDDDDENDDSESSENPLKGIPLPPGIHIGSIMPDIKADEDFDGVSAKELIRALGQNALYYLPIFRNIKLFNTSRFNFAAFIFGGGWYLYRKQYLKGILITLLTIAVNAAQVLINYFYAGALWSKAYEALGSSDTTSYLSYFKWMSENCTSFDLFMMILPYILAIASWVIIIVCGFTANRGYYKFITKKIRRIKEESPDLTDDQLLDKLRVTGGVNNGLAFMLIACEIILLVSSMIFSSTF